MTIYEELIERVSNGETFHIDFEKRTMKVGKEYLIRNGEYDSERLLIKADGNVLCTIEQMYNVYKYSLPSERSDDKRKKYFKALEIEELSDEQLFVATKREVAQCKLEGYVLCAILSGQLKWDDNVMQGKWFYQSKNDPSLIILKSWIENK